MSAGSLSKPTVVTGSSLSNHSFGKINLLESACDVVQALRKFNFITIIGHTTRQLSSVGLLSRFTVVTSSSLSDHSFGKIS